MPQNRPGRYLLPLLTSIIAFAAAFATGAHAQTSASQRSETKGYASAQEGQIDRLVKAVDRTHTGKISRNDTKQFVLDNFDRLDADHDGTLSLEELEAPLRAQLSHASGTDQASLRSSLRSLGQDFKEMGKDRNGTVSKDEYVAFVQRQFDAANADKDETLEPKELASSKGRRILVLLGALASSQPQ